MNSFSFYNPTKIIFGENKTSVIGSEISNFGIKKVLLLYGGGSIKKNGVYDTVITSLKENGIEFLELSGVVPNPVIEKVYEGIELCKNQGVQAVLAVGGGSVLDSAKVIAAGALHDGDIWDAFEGKFRVQHALPVFTILTLSATGSEMNVNAVVTKKDENKKWAMLTSVCSYPVVSIMDPTVQYDLPVEQTINGAVDALSHVLETYFDLSVNVDIQDEFAEAIMRTIIKHSIILLENPANYESRSQLMWCSTLALNGILLAGRNGGDWATHGMEHSISAFYDVAHAEGLALLFPAWMKYVYKQDIPRFKRFAERVFGVMEGSDEEKALEGIDSLQDFFEDIGAPTCLEDVGIPESDIEKLVMNSLIKGEFGRVKKLNKEDVRKIFKLAL